DVLLEDRFLVVCKTVIGGGLEVQGAGEERRHLAAGHRLARAEPSVVGRVAAAGDALGSDGLDVALVEVAVVVDERAPRIEVLSGGDGARDDRQCGEGHAQWSGEAGALHSSSSLPSGPR